MIPSLNVIDTECVPEYEAVGLIVNVEPDSETKEGYVEVKVIGSDSASYVAGRV